MLKRLKTYFNWSSGKDAALALYYLRQQKKYNLDRLLTCVNGFHNRVSMHGLRRELLLLQVESVGLPLKMIELSEQPNMAEYDHIMHEAIHSLKTEGYSDCGFGDIFLEDLRIYRENQLKPHKITPHFPLWKKDTKSLVKNFIRLGFKAIIICVDARVLEKSFLGREIDNDFLNALPPNVDPCGENGEFHTFCYAGPIFKKSISFKIGEFVHRTYKSPQNSSGNNANQGFWFCDLIPN